jgi:hypothetical protein
MHSATDSTIPPGLNLRGGGGEPDQIVKIEWVLTVTYTSACRLNYVGWFETELKPQCLETYVNNNKAVLFINRDNSLLG